MVQLAPVPAWGRVGIGQDLARGKPGQVQHACAQGKCASRRRGPLRHPAPANGTATVKRTAPIAFGSCTGREAATYRGNRARAEPRATRGAGGLETPGRTPCSPSGTGNSATDTGNAAATGGRLVAVPPRQLALRWQFWIRGSPETETAVRTALWRLR